MAIYTLEEIEAEISVYKNALTSLALNKTVTIGDKTLQRQDSEFVRSHLLWLDQQRSCLNSTAVGRTYGKNGRNR